VKRGHTHLFAGRLHAVQHKPFALDTTVGVSFQFNKAGTRRHRLREVVGRVKACERRPLFERRVKRGYAHSFARCPRAVQLKSKIPKGWSAVLVTALGSWEKSVPRGHL
jgi:hypothetical protein